MLESLTRRPVPVAVGAVAVTLAITAAGIGLLTRGTDLRGQLDARVTEILEHSSVAEHQAHGHDFGGGPARVV
ncbi:MAG: hypothetical protein HOY71_40880, partial [Nonomuraea sp.]|nr:hypothetical protein [Nonomuraea sp.]